jgi:hypothetical protein
MHKSLRVQLAIENESESTIALQGFIEVPRMPAVGDRFTHNNIKERWSGGETLWRSHKASTTTPTSPVRNTGGYKDSEHGRTLPVTGLTARNLLRVLEALQNGKRAAAAALLFAFLGCVAPVPSS